MRQRRWPSPDTRLPPFSSASMRVCISDPAEAECLVRPASELNAGFTCEGPREPLRGHLPWIDEFSREGSIGQWKVVIDGLVIVHEVENVLCRASGRVGGGCVQVISRRSLRFEPGTFGILSGVRGSLLHQLAQEGDASRTASMQLAAV